MAKILPYWGTMSGSMRGCTFSHNKGGQYVRGRTVPTNPTTSKQTAARSAFGTNSSAWYSLTNAQRAAWSDWAAINPVVDSLGESINLSGQQAYVGLNTRVYQAGGTPSTTPPVAAAPGDLLTCTATGTAATGAIVLTYTTTPLAAGTKLSLWATLPQAASRNPNRAQARLIGYTAAAAASPQTLTCPYTAVAGQTSNLWVCVVDAAGQVSPGRRINLVWA